MINNGGPSRQASLTMQMSQPQSYSAFPPVPPKDSPNPSISSPSTDWNQGPQHAESSSSSRRNPLVDLIDSEKLYVDQLSLVIRKVAAAWSRKDFPPPKLDAMFRAVEAVYRANRGFGQKLKDIGPSPSSPKALGDLLMRWIDDLETPYRRYCSTFLSGFDSYSPVTKNTLLPDILDDISVSTPPSPPLDHWTLDTLFLLPYTRLRYYRKLYARLLRSTKEGRSDHRLLVVANQRLEALVAEIEGRLDMDVTDDSPPPPAVVSAPGSNGERSREPSWQETKSRASKTSSAMDSSMDSHDNFSPFSSRVEDRNSGGSVATSLTQSPQRRPPLPNSLSDLEFRIDPDRTLDLFTMTPKKCKLQMNPPTLPYTRSLRSSHDVTIQFSPTAAPAKTHRRAHIFILTDLFIVAEWMEANDKAAKAIQVAKEQPERVGQGGPMPEMWLCYPPLAGKHLMVAEGSQANVMTVMIMRKETLVIHAESDLARDQIMKDMIDCIDFATNISRRNTAVPSPNGDARTPSSLSEGREGPIRYPSPFSASSSPSISPRPSDGQDSGMPPVPLAGNALVSQMSRINLEPGETVAWQRGPSPPPPVAAPMTGGGSLPPRGASLRMRQASGPLPPQLPALSFGGSDPSLNSNTTGGIAVGTVLPRSPSGRSVHSAPRPDGNYQPHHPPVPPMRDTRGPGSHMSETMPPSVYPTAPFHSHSQPSRSRSAEPLRIDPLAPPRPINLNPGPIQSPSARFSSFVPDGPTNDSTELSPPPSPVEDTATTLSGPATITAQMKCKVFLKQSHQQWKSLGGGKLKLYAGGTGGRMIKQLVVESDGGKKEMLISTIVLTDGVERVAKTGVAVEISDRGKRTGIVYMIQLRNENSAAGLFESLLAGSDRSTRA